jgi:hypothetical protein
MIIKANSKKDNTPRNNYKLLYQKIKEEIKSVVINKLLNQVQTLSNNYQKLLKENSLIKSDLIYILKRVLLNKKEYIQIPNSTINKNYQMKSVYSMPYLTNNSFINKKDYYSVLSSDNIKENNYYNLYRESNRLNNSMNKRQRENRRYSIDDDTKRGNNSSLNNNVENSTQFNNIQNKVDYYLNSLYKHNFAEEVISGTSSVHLLNKDKPLYDELFKKKNKNFPHLSTEINFRKISNQKKKVLNVDFNNDKNIKTDNQSDNNRNKKGNNGLKVQRKNVLKKNKNLQIKENTNIKLFNSENKNSKISQNINTNSRSKVLTKKFIFK